ncbi:Dabb family protein [Spiractinospora alimapuensis]|uniref:Dabb family protein n=1 Tax=Spiractinospora alimapuensis TaxID=2820884 RepID=UPI001F23D88F|nr:Dabb family protein [Spiractinospora alimapuensis]QVQ52319.1 Dabb family protein [Spiractinospora alimapuensis]
MIYHCIRFTIKPGVSQETVDAIIAGMTAENSGDSSAFFGRDVGGEYEYGAVSVWEDLESYEAMMNDPAHLEIDRVGLPLIEKFMSFDISDDPDPEFAEKIAAIHQRRFDAHPDLVELIDNLKEYTGSAAPGRHAV